MYFNQEPTRLQIHSLKYLHYIVFLRNIKLLHTLVLSFCGLGHVRNVFARWQRCYADLLGKVSMGGRAPPSEMIRNK